VRLTLRITVYLFIAFASISFASGCRTLSLEVETPGDAARYRTWNFAHPTRDVTHAPLFVGTDFESAVSQQVEAELSDRGFQRTANNPDLLVFFQLGVREQLVEQHVTGAMQHLPSLHNAPSYDVQVTRTEFRRFEIAELLFVMVESNGRQLVWRGRLNDRYLDGFKPHLREAVSQLLAQVPFSRPSLNGQTAIVREEAPLGISISGRPVQTSLESGMLSR
jgi:hypothetical protein